MSPLSIPPADEILLIGASCMSDAKLIHLLLGDSVSQEECARLGSALHLDVFARMELLRSSSGGPRLLAGLELGKRAVWNSQFSLKRSLLSPTDAAAYARPWLRSGPEVFLVLALDGHLQVARMTQTQPGNRCSVETSPAGLLGPVLSSGCEKMICLHHHPSGLAHPSAYDIQSTQKLAELAGSLGIILLDHIILGQGQIFSFLQEGLLPGGDPRYS